MKILYFLLFSGVTSFSNSIYAETFQYNCFSYYWNGYDSLNGTMNLTVSADNAEGEFLEGPLEELTIGGNVNQNYKSRGDVVYVKYGSNLILENTLLTGGKKLRDGSLGGFARVEGQAEGGFYQYKFVCKQRNDHAFGAKPR